MKIAILGGGVEGQSVQNYFSIKGDDCQIFDNFEPDQLDSKALDTFDLVFRSPSVRPPLEIPTNWTSITRYFFQHCPCPIIGVTGTKGKGTTCSMLSAILNSLGHKNYLVGNIGTPALDILDQLTPTDTVIYELSSFQLWDLEQSPHIAVVLRIEPDHLNVHRDFADYVDAKSHITAYQKADDVCIYYRDNPDSVQIAKKSQGQIKPYPLIIPQDSEKVNILTSQLTIPGAHNRENAEAALLAASSYHGQSLDDFITQHNLELTKALANFQGLPHRLEFIRELNGVKYYDDNFSSAFPALDVALQTFADQPTVLIAGGKDRHLDLSQTIERLNTAPNLIKVILIGETSQQLAAGLDPQKYQLARTLSEAVAAARTAAEAATGDSIVVMSPGAASFDMFKDFKDRGEQFQKIINGLQ